MAAIFALDDELPLLKVYERLLRKHGHVVLTHDHPALLISRFELGESPALLITDFNMPAMDGGEVVRRVREKGFTGPILMISDVKQVPEGVTARLQKPFENDVLVATVNRLLEGAVR
jgi:FixJ family two-component response regulator